MKKILKILFITLALQGCSASNINSSWQCPTPVIAGKPCLNISESDAKAKQVQKVSKLETKNQLLQVTSLKGKPDIKGKQIGPIPHRTSESIARIWFAPFIDKYSNRHDSSMVHFVDQTSSWRK